MRTYAQEKRWDSIGQFDDAQVFFGIMAFIEADGAADAGKALCFFYGGADFVAIIAGGAPDRSS